MQGLGNGPREAALGLFCHPSESRKTAAAKYSPWQALSFKKGATISPPANLDPESWGLWPRETIQVFTLRDP